MARLPSARFATLCNCLRAILNGLSSISNLKALYRRLLNILSNFLLSCLSRKPPCAIPHPFQPAGGPSSPQSSIQSAIAASNLPGVSMAPTNIPGKNTSSPCRRHITFGTPFTLPGIIGLQSQSHPQVQVTTPRRMVPFVAADVQRYGKDMRMQVAFGVSPAEEGC
jgi:hypothetical protein